MLRSIDGLQAASNGCYDAARAAALSGVPRSTLYYWAREGVVEPTISPVQEKLWSYADLMALRIVAWLRRPKAVGAGEPLPPSPMGKVRQALAILPEYGVELWSDATDPKRGSSLLVDQRGDIFIQAPEGMFNLRGDRALPQSDSFGLTGPFQTITGHRGPDLIRPRPDLRIVPAKVAGEPHVKGTRLTTVTLAAMVRRGFALEELADMYEVAVGAIEQAVDLESQLAA